MLKSVLLIKMINWKLILLEMLEEENFFLNIIANNSMLLVNFLKNCTDEIVQTGKITGILIQSIIENVNQYNVISIEQLYSVYKELGISSENYSDSYSFSMKIANYLKADYILYGMVCGTAEHPYVELELIVVQSGEILRTIHGIP